MEQQAANDCPIIPIPAMADFDRPLNTVVELNNEIVATLREEGLSKQEIKTGTANLVFNVLIQNKMLVGVTPNNVQEVVKYVLYN